MTATRGPGRAERTNRGQSTVEFALGLSLLVTVAVGVAQVALVVTAQVLAMQIAGEVARAVSIDPAADPGAIAAAVSPVTDDRLRVEVEWVEAAASDRARVDVRVVIEVPSLVPFIDTVPVDWISRALSS